jgi:hypothetical protein
VADSSCGGTNYVPANPKLYPPFTSPVATILKLPSSHTVFIGRASAHIDCSASQPQDIGYGSDPSSCNPTQKKSNSFRRCPELHPGNASCATNEAVTRAEGSTDFSEPRSMSLHGVEIGRVTGKIVQDIAVSCDFGGLRVWIFMYNGLVRMWTLFRKASLTGG